MNGLNQWIGQLRIHDMSHAPFEGDPLLPFAFDELTCRAIARGDAGPTLHLWRHRRAFVLGLRDRKLPDAAGAAAALEAAGWRTAVRHSGGAAVPLDAGVLNVSLLLPQPKGIARLQEDFALMEAFIRAALRRLAPGIRAATGEVGGAYCPGGFDLAIGGRKFCGIAQRRLSGAFMLQAFVVVEGSGAELARVAADFYRRARGRGGLALPAAERGAGRAVERTTGRHTDREGGSEAGRDPEEGESRAAEMTAHVPGALDVLEASTASLREWIGNMSVARFAETLKRIATGDRAAAATPGTSEAPALKAAAAAAKSGYDDEALAGEAARIRSRYDDDRGAAHAGVSGPAAE